MSAFGGSGSGRGTRLVVGSSVAVAVIASLALVGPALTAAASTDAVAAIPTVAELAARFAAAADGETIVLTDDLEDRDGERPPIVVPGGRSVTLDLAGHDVYLRPVDYYAGLAVYKGSGLTITDSGGTGKLQVYGGWGSAGIGGSWGHDAGRITIDSGTIYPGGGDWSAGIGGSHSGSFESITINGGHVLAEGSDSSAGIGAGYKAQHVAPNEQTITINGGVVQGSGGDQGPGIGSGRSSNGVIVSITGGVVAAFGSSGGAGIGSGDHGADSGTVSISAGQVTARGAAGGAGIGGGLDTEGAAVTVSGGTVVATGSDGGAGIGGGNMGGEGSLTITGGAVTADGTAAAMAIGAGAFRSKLDRSTGFLSNAGTLTIPSGTSLTITRDVTMMNSGTLINKGTLAANGDIENSGVIVTDSPIEGTGTVKGHNVSILLDLNGGVRPTSSGASSIFASSYAAGQASFPAAATRPGHRFVGWFTERDGGTLVAPDTDLGDGGPKTLTLYAHWAAEEDAMPDPSGSLPDSTVDPAPTGAEHPAALAASGAPSALGPVLASFSLLGGGALLLMFRLRQRPRSG